MSGRYKYTETKLFLTALAVIIAAFLITGMTEEAHAYAKLSFSAKVPKNADWNTVRCAFKTTDKRVSYYRLKCSLNGKTVKAVMFSSKKTTYTFKRLKKNREYDFALQAFNKKGDQIKFRSTGFYTGMRAPLFDEYFEYMTTYGDRIDLCFHNMGGAYPVRRFDLYKKTSSGTWKLIRSYDMSKKQKAYLSYKDSKVRYGRLYSYRVRAVAKAKVKGKSRTLKSKFTSISLEAVNSTGTVTCGFGEETPAGKEMRQVVVDVTMDKYNCPAEFDFDDSSRKAYVDDSEESAGIAVFDVAEYRSDEGEWSKAEGKVTVEPGQTISLRLILPEDQPAVDFTVPGYLHIYGLRYNDSRRALFINPGKGIGSIYIPEY